MPDATAPSPDLPQDRPRPDWLIWVLPLVMVGVGIWVFLDGYVHLPPSSTDDDLVELAWLLVVFCWVALVLSAIIAVLLARPRISRGKAATLIVSALASPAWALILVYAGLFVFGGVLTGLVWGSLVGWTFGELRSMSGRLSAGLTGGGLVGLAASLAAWGTYSYTGATRIADPFLMAPSAGLVVGTLGMSALHRVLVHRRAVASRGLGQCEQCGYSLAGLPSAVCPECGTQSTAG